MSRSSGGPGLGLPFRRLSLHRRQSLDPEAGGAGLEEDGQVGAPAGALQLEWISAAEGIRFAEVMAGMEELRRTVTRKELAETPEIIRENFRKKKVKRKKKIGWGLPEV